LKGVVFTPTCGIEKLETDYGSLLSLADYEMNKSFAVVNTATVASKMTIAAVN